MDIAESLSSIIQKSPSIEKANERLLKMRLIKVKGVAGALKSFLLVNFLRHFSTQILYIGSGLEEIEAVKEEVQLLLKDEFVGFFPGEVQHRFGLHFSNRHTKTAQLSTLECLVKKQPQVLVAHSSGLLFDLPTPKEFVSHKISISVSDNLEFNCLVSKLVELGFTREVRVEDPGQVSVRGGIVDVFPFSSEYPCRIEFWGDEVESLRLFDPVTQRSLRQKRSIELYPQEFSFSDAEQSPSESDLLDFLRTDAVVVLDEPELIRKTLEPNFADGSQEYELAFENISDDSGADAPMWHKIKNKVEKFRQVRLVSFGTKEPDLIDLNAKNQDSLKGNLKLLRRSFAKLREERSKGGRKPPRIFFLCDKPDQTKRMEAIFEDEKISSANLTVATLELHKGFIFPEANLAVFTDHQFYGRRKRLRLPKKTPGGLTPIQFRSLNVGDYVVHVDFGIGLFRGLKKITVNGQERECLHLEYKDGDNLYVRFERMDRVHKYSSKEGMKPPLSKLGSPEWQRLKSRTKKKIKDIANELIEIYAKRKSQPGFGFSEDTLWQRELEASFQYEDTPDQSKATVEVKRDMESEKPMDRLVCGDVGFGKTEIAVRAAFKTILSGKQVAMLVPTTILAYQHFNTFKQRLEKFPVQVEMLSRFRSKAEQKVIVEKIKRGQVDIIIGTHRILSKDVAYKDLGLLIIDEEQRFGVRHKEQLKKLKTNIDVLTLTATPIPRTLHLSLLGARDITNIDTPPKNRLPIVTEILPFNKAYIREVILSELERGGQVFFVHNRVRTIERMATMLSGLIPEASVVVAHGQMPEKELEEVMVDFMQKKYQILVSTMIIESGLDMPNVNTIIVNRADKFGLAQLYQLRGRVGRSHQRAYAYLLIPPVETMTEDAVKRLRAIEEFSEVGSGSQLAMRDLEIRGAGNLLGAEQSGFIDVLGFELYNKLLDEAVAELRKEKNPEEETVPEVETQIEIETDARLPDMYISSATDRVDIYQRLIESTSIKQLEGLAAELEDRFGRLPDPVDNLLNYLALRITGKNLGLAKITVLRDEMVAEFSPSRLSLEGEPFKRWLGTMVEHANAPFEFIQNEGLGIRLDLKHDDDNKLLIIKEFLQSLDGANSSSSNLSGVVSSPNDEEGRNAGSGQSQVCDEE